MRRACKSPGPDAHMSRPQGRAWHGVSPGPSPELTPWLTEKVGQLSPPIQPLRTRRVIKSSVPLSAGANKDATQNRVLALERHSIPTAMPWTDVHKRHNGT